MNLLVSDIVDLGQLETWQFILDEQPISIPGLLTELRGLFIRQAKCKQLSLDLFHDPLFNERKVILDRQRILQVMTNLLANSLKFTRVGSIEVIVESDLIDDTIKLKVRDSGVGIPQDSKKKLFCMFGFVSEESETGQWTGCGLGLTICKGLVEKMGGWVDLSSEENLGTEVVCSIPLKLAPLEESEEEAREETDYPMSHRQSTPNLLRIDTYHQSKWSELRAW